MGLELIWYLNLALNSILTWTTSRMQAILLHGYICPLEIRSAVKNCFPRKHSTYPVESLLHSVWRLQQLAWEISRWALCSSIIIPHRESINSQCNEKKTRNTVPPLSMDRNMSFLPQIMVFPCNLALIVIIVIHTCMKLEEVCVLAMKDVVLNKKWGSYFKTHNKVKPTFSTEHRCKDKRKNIAKTNTWLT